MATARTLTADDRAEAIEELEGALKAIRQALDEARETMRRVGGMARERAEAYWIAQIEGCLEGRGSMHTLQDTIDELTRGEDD